MNVHDSYTVPHCILGFLGYNTYLLFLVISYYPLIKFMVNHVSLMSLTCVSLN